MDAPSLTVARVRKKYVCLQSTAVSLVSGRGRNAGSFPEQRQIKRIRANVGVKLCDELVSHPGKSRNTPSHIVLQKP